MQGCEEESTVSQSVRQSETQAATFDYKHIELENGLDVITLEDFSCPAHSRTETTFNSPM